MMQGKLPAFIAIMLAPCACAQPADASTAPLRSGFYEGFVLAVSPAGRVVGHFHLEQGNGVTKGCTFDFTGQASGDRAVIHTLGSPRLQGKIAAVAEGEVMFSMAHVTELPGCGLVLPPEAETGDGAELDQIRRGTWTDLAMVKSARVAFKPGPGEAAGRSYIVKGDVVGILARQGNQVQVVYPSERANWAQGWVPASDLTPLAP